MGTILENYTRKFPWAAVRIALCSSDKSCTSDKFVLARSTMPLSIAICFAASFAWSSRLLSLDFSCFNCFIFKSV